MSATVLVCSRMFDGTSEELTGMTEISIEGNRITSIGRSVNRPPGAQVIDLSDRTVKGKDWYFGMEAHVGTARSRGQVTLT